MSIQFQPWLRDLCSNRVSLESNRWNLNRISIKSHDTWVESSLRFKSRFDFAHHCCVEDIRLATANRSRVSICHKYFLPRPRVWSTVIVCHTVWAYVGGTISWGSWNLGIGIERTWTHWNTCLSPCITEFGRSRSNSMGVV